MKTWTSFIKRKDKKYFITKGTPIEIMGKSVKRITALGLPNSLYRDIEYEEMGEIPFEWGNLEELEIITVTDKTLCQCREPMISEKRYCTICGKDMSK